VPISISVLALVVSGSQAYINYRERKRVMPSVGMHAVYVDQMVVGDGLRKVVSIHLENKGREATTVRNLDISSNGGTFVNGLNCLLDEKGDPISRDARDETLPGFSSRHYVVDASMIQGDEVLAVAGFGHGPKKIAHHLPLNRMGSRKPLSECKFDKIQDSWEKHDT
jgi:hypothetical protein